MRVLIVEDDLTIRNLVAEFLTDEGFEVVEAEHGREAVELASIAQPDLILMDLMMPVLDGVSAIKELKENPATSHIRVVAMSAGRRLRGHADDLPADGLLTKPFDLDGLLATVLVHARQTGSSDHPDQADVKHAGLPSTRTS